MKKLVIIMMSIALVSGVSAQRHGGGGYRPVYGRSGIGFGGGLGIGLGLGYGFGYPFFGYPYYGYPPTYYTTARQSKLTRQIEDIKSEYADRIYSARNATDLNGKQRRAEVRQLKQERDNAINNLRNNYYKRPTQTNTQNSIQNNTTPDNSTPKVQE